MNVPPVSEDERNAHGAALPHVSNPVTIRSTTGLPAILSGADALRSGFRWLMRYRNLWKYSALSILVALLIVVLLLAAAWRTHAWLMGYFERPDAGWGIWAWWLGRWMLWLGLLAGALALSPILSSLAAAPFHDRLSERVEEMVNGPAAGEFSWSTIARDVATGIAHSLLNLAIYIPLALFCLALNIIPLVGSAVGAVGGFMLTAAMLALEFCDYPESRRRWSWRQKVALIRQQPRLMLGFGAAAALLLSIPLATLVTAPIAVVGGTLLFLRMEEAGLLATSAGQSARALGNADDIS